VVVLALVLAFGALAVARAQEARENPPRPVFRLGVSLVQLDAVVTDRQGRHVTDLTPDEFEIYQDGRRQPVTAAVYVEVDDHFVPTPYPEDDGATTSGEIVRPRDARRTIAIVVDDLRMGFVSVAHARSALKRFVTTSLRGDDLVGLLTTSGEPGTSAPFSYNRADLSMAIGRLRFSMFGLRAASILEPVSGFGDDLVNGYREASFAVGALARVEAIIDALQSRPGRKAIVLVSEGFTIFAPGNDNVGIEYAMHRLVDRANRAGVVIYAVDPRGLVVTGLTAADNTSGMSPHGMNQLASRRADALRESQNGLRYVTGETGGFAVVDDNDLTGGFRRVLDDQQGYYLIGYQPEAGTFDTDASGRFRKVKVRVTRKGVKVRTRAGFYGVRTE
jgi:VWFA-related protein